MFPAVSQFVRDWLFSGRRHRANLVAPVHDLPTKQDDQIHQSLERVEKIAAAEISRMYEAAADHHNAAAGLRRDSEERLEQSTALSKLLEDTLEDLRPRNA